MAPTEKEIANPKLLSILEQNWHAEMEGFYAYRAFADRERNPARKNTLLHLADAERNHASLWSGRMAELGANAPLYRGKTDGVSLLNRIGGSEMALRRLEIEESRDIAKYAKQLKELGDERSTAILNAVLQDEQEHYLALSALLRNRFSKHAAKAAGEDPKTLLDTLLARRTTTGRRPAGWIGDAIYGVNDGLGAIFGIVSGVSGATLGNRKFVLLAGLASAKQSKRMARRRASCSRSTIRSKDFPQSMPIGQSSTLPKILRSSCERWPANA